MAQDQTSKKNYSHEIDCMRQFLKLLYHENSPVHYSITDSFIKVFYYYYDIDLFDLDKDIAIFKQFLKRCNDANMKKDRNIYTTLYKVILYNSKYPKWRPHTVDILRTKYILDKKLVKDMMLDYF